MKWGVSYYPELVEDTEWGRDLDGMRANGLTVVRILEFAWSKIEPRPGQYEFDWLDRFLALIQERQMEVILGTPTAAPPAWLIHRHPEIMVELRNGQRLVYGERRAACVNSTVYRRFSAAIAGTLGKRYGQHAAVMGWQIDNELIGPEIDKFECHCPDCQVRFREWLQQRYASVAAINRAWGLGFWSMDFSSWEEIPTPRCQRAVAGHVLDFFRFYNDSQVEYLRLQYAALRAAIAPRQFISHNSTGIFDRTINHRDYARTLDETGWDAYRGAAANVHSQKDSYSALAHDLFRSALHKPFWIFETNADDTITPAFLAEMRAHGAKGVIFWHWRRHRANLEQTAAALCDYAGHPYQHRLDWVREIQKQIAATPPLPAQTPVQKAAILFSADCVRAEHRNPRRPMPYLDALIRLYEPFWQMGVPLDVVNPGDDLAPYKLVLMPALRLLSREAAEKIRAYVAGGGVLLATAKTAHQDQHGVFYPTLGEALADVVGFTLGDDGHHPSPLQIRMADGSSFASDPYFERVTATTAKVLGWFEGGELDGQPAVLQNPFGRGQVFYVAGLSLPLNACVGRQAAATAGLTVHENPHAGVAVYPDLTGQGIWYFNHGRESRKLEGVSLPAGGFAYVRLANATAPRSPSLAVPDTRRT